MIMAVRPLRALLAFHRHGTIAAAAEEVHLSPAAVSVQLKLLEEQLGIPLFERTKRSIRLTSAGYGVVPLVEKVLTAYEELLRHSGSSSIHGRISLGVVNNVLVGVFPAVVQRVIRDCPGMEINVSMGTSPDLVAKVAAGLLDAAVVSQPPKSLGDEFIVHKLFDEPIALIQLPHSARGSLRDVLGACPYIALDRDTWAGRQIQNHLERQEIDVEPIMELNSQEAILAAVRFGLGVTVLPLTRGADIGHDERLKITRIAGLSRTISMAERKTHIRSNMTAQVLSSFKSVLAESAATGKTAAARRAAPAKAARRPRTGD
ncbi:LysR family transcriptional regulator [Candidimonas nitroreducens]|uniref:LysR family transcriptional regulator n=1 Tax=Candidimonas nitroreducens TaxID=683354 RepID=A0A225MB86_9BURK|nr:LysR family transcriptional regulator [Candidimonas nitroreducens]